MSGRTSIAVNANPNRHCYCVWSKCRVAKYETERANWKSILSLMKLQCFQSARSFPYMSADEVWLNDQIFAVSLRCLKRLSSIIFRIDFTTDPFTANSATEFRPKTVDKTVLTLWKKIIQQSGLYRSIKSLLWVCLFFFFRNNFISRKVKTFFFWKIAKI